MALFTLFDEKQFKQISLLLNGINGAINKAAENIGPPETSVVETLNKIDKTLTDGFAGIIAAISTLTIPALAPTKPLEVKFMFVVKDDQPSVNFSLVLGDVTDAEGHTIPDAQIDLEVESSDKTVVSVSFDPASRSGNVSFGAPGVASVTAKVSSGGNLLGSGAADFTVTVGDPAAISSVGLAFEGLTEAPPA
jgi:hypothetical protein